MTRRASADRVEGSRSGRGLARPGARRGLTEGRISGPRRRGWPLLAVPAPMRLSSIRDRFACAASPRVKQPLVNWTGREHVLMGAESYQAAMIHDGYFVDQAQDTWGDGVRDDEGRAALNEGQERLMDQTLALGVGCRRCFVENQNCGIAENGSRQGNALPLSSRQAASLFPDASLDPFGHLVEESRHIRTRRRVLDLRSRCSRPAVARTFS